ncbi:ScbR family autoregulator-binding transcription factor [Streptomyces sp. NPDC006739]|uniref:ScbR family autoregulator-binding transcription factor n=1 Tax=Streptomyces sp. NPDC006739 TaxID=3364763 RepID=UPI0036A9CDFE
MVKQVRAARTRQSLIRAAAEVFADDGYAMASLPSISKRAGVSAGALHFHFASKDALAREVESAATNSAEKMAEHCRSTADTLLQTLVHTTCSLMFAVLTEPVVRAGFRLGGDPSRRDATGLLQWWSEWVHGLIAQAQAAGELAEGVSPDGAAATIVAATVGFEGIGSRDQDWLSQERMSQFWAFLLPRLAASPPYQQAFRAGGTESSSDALS